MSNKTSFTTLLIAITVTAWLTGCAKYATSDQAMTAIEDKVSIGMTESAFTSSVPNAQLIQTADKRSVYAVRVSPPCFVCGSVKGFTKSYETYATEFVFERGELVSFNRFLDGE